jgi:hypothetical protein
MEHNMLKMLALLASCSLPAPASAFDCAEWSFLQEFWQRMDQPAIHELVYGKFTAFGTGRHEKTADAVFWETTFTGYSASRTTFDQPIETRVTIIQPLLSEFVGEQSSPNLSANWLADMEGLVFLEQTDEGYLAVNGVCAPLFYSDQADVRQALDCLNGQRCPKP